MTRAPMTSLSARPCCSRVRASDERNFVKKAVNMALRDRQTQSRVHATAVVVAQCLATSPESAARWVGKKCSEGTHQYYGDPSARDATSPCDYGDPPWLHWSIVPGRTSASGSGSQSRTGASAGPDACQEFVARRASTGPTSATSSGAYRNVRSDETPSPSRPTPDVPAMLGPRPPSLPGRTGPARPHAA